MSALPRIRPATGEDEPRRTAPRIRGAAGRLSSAGELVFLAPIVAIVGFVLLVPAVSVFTHSFTQWNPGGESPGVGLQNFSDLLSSPAFHQILGNQAFLLLGLPVWTVVPLVIAVLLYERVPAPGVFRTVFFFPATVSPAIIGILFSAILAPEGPLNHALRSLGLGGVAKGWLSDPQLVKPVLIAVLLWATVGTGVVIFSAALSTLPREQLEAAEIDGASWWQRLRFIIVPALMTTLQMWVVLLVITVFVGVFPWIYTLTRGGPGNSSTTIDFDIYQNALTFGYFGLAAAEAVLLLAIVVCVVLIRSGVARAVRSR